MDSKKLNVAIVIGSDLFSGGGFQYEYSILCALNKYHKQDDIILNFYCFNELVKKDYESLNLDIKVIKENLFQRIHRYSLSSFFLRRLYKKFFIDICSVEARLKKDRIDLIYFLSQSSISYELNYIPYIFTLWDLGHLDISEFPEVSHGGEFERREELYTKALKKAFRVIVDLDYSKVMAFNKYNLDEKRIEVVRFIPNIRPLDEKSYVNIKEKYNLKNDYVFYPAQFWAHKNHMYILKAIKILKEEKKIKLDVVFSGSNKGNLDYILKTAKEFGISDLVHYIGFAPNAEIPYLYNQSVALVMPTYLGPTNIPPLEAFTYGASLCYSDTPFFREQVGDAAFFIDLKNPQSLVDNLIEITTQEDIVKFKKEIGLKVLQDWSDVDVYKKINNIFNEYKYIRELWK